ncbi:MAG TPA: TIGR02300 family protein [Hyphomicrobiaceae bacterium]|jgi:uncharacterized protein (TIGR02300 family)|nr:TIGR02300 family protein [Hyphomicrobiaceae bacterium]
MSATAGRGTKRTCQNPDCGSRFYDLNKNPIVCPICESVYEIARGPAVPTAAAADAKQARKPKKPVYEVADSVKPEDAPEAEGEEALAIEADEEAADASDDETFLEEEEEEGPDVSGIIGGPVAETDESQ